MKIDICAKCGNKVDGKYQIYFCNTDDVFARNKGFKFCKQCYEWLRRMALNI